MLCNLCEQITLERLQAMERSFEHDSYPRFSGIHILGDQDESNMFRKMGMFGKLSLFVDFGTSLILPVRR